MRITGNSDRATGSMHIHRGDQSVARRGSCLNGLLDSPLVRHSKGIAHCFQHSIWEQQPDSFPRCWLPHPKHTHHNEVGEQQDKPGTDGENS